MAGKELFAIPFKKRMIPKNKKKKYWEKFH